MSSPLQELFDRLRDGIDSLRQKLNFNRDHYYLTQKCEPALSVLQPGVAWTVEGRYGATLVSRNMAIWDVDLGRANSNEADIGWLRDDLGEAIESYRFRVYQTLGGLRVICANRTVAYGDAISMAWFKDIGSRLRADHRYMAISERQLCSRARLDPKPIEHRGYILHGPIVELAELTKLAEDGQVRACRFIGEVGTGEIHPDLARQIEVHDLGTEALDSTKELF
jgi:hypothetical protein